MSRWEVWAPTTGAGHADPLVDRLNALLGAGRVLVLTRPGGSRGPRCLVQPDTTEAVAKAVRVLRESGVTSAVVFTPPPFDPPDAPAGGVYIDASRLFAVLSVDETSLTVSVQTGITWGRLEGLLARRGFTLGPVPLWLQGRAVAESVGLNDRLRPSPRYGQLVDALHAVTAVLPGGEVARTTSAPRRATGPELPATLFGTGHRNGLLTEAHLQIWRRAAEAPRASFTLPGWTAADAFARRVLQAGIRPAVMVGSGVAGGADVAFSVELCTAADGAALTTLAAAEGLARRSRHEVLESAFGAADGAPTNTPVVACLAPPAALAAVAKILPRARAWDLGGAWLSLWTDTPVDAVTRARLVEAGARVVSAPTGFEALGDAVTRALSGEV